MIPLEWGYKEHVLPRRTPVTPGTPKHAMMNNRMEVVRLDARAKGGYVDIPRVPTGITDWEENGFRLVVTAEMTSEQEKNITTPPRQYRGQKSVLAVHWHPESVPLELIRTRIESMYPHNPPSLVIPTQHNELVSYDGLAGVEVDCFAASFNRKVQLLLHFREERLTNADVLKSMLAHTFKYRSSQFFEYLHALHHDKAREVRNAATLECGATPTETAFAGAYAQKLLHLIEEHESEIPAAMLKNKLVRDYFDTLRDHYGDAFITRTQVYLRAVKQAVKARFPLKHFYRAEEIIEEARLCGGGVVIPHPEQFWPILLAGYDVDGYEVWNPRSREFTEFLINVVHEQNSTPSRKKSSLLVFMGDDCHMGDKLRDPTEQSSEKAAREIGYQPAWDDTAIRKSLIRTGMDRSKVIEEYSGRLL